ncbi:MAG: DMT family transporter [Clostridia bacterium]|nr:DMT family transporter [Clostridia bacterium]
MPSSSPRSATGSATLAALMGNSIFGFSFMFSRIALGLASPFVMLMYRFLFAFALLSLVALWACCSRQEGWLRFRLSAKGVWRLLLLGLVQPVAYFLCESYGISMTNATVSGVIIALVPIAAMAASTLFLKEKPTWKQVMFSLLSISGVIVMTLQQSAGGAIQPLGIVLLIGAVITGASFNIMSRQLSTHFSALERTWVMMGVACISFTLLALWESRAALEILAAPMGQPAFIGAIAYLSVLSSILAFLLLNYSATILPVSKTTAFCNVTTLLSVFAGVVFLGESITWVSLAAALIIIVGVFGVQKT